MVGGNYRSSALWNILKGVLTLSGMQGGDWLHQLFGKLALALSILIFVIQKAMFHQVILFNPIPDT